METNITQLNIKTVCGKKYDTRELKPMAKTKSGTGVEHFVLYETPDELYLKCTLPPQETAATLPQAEIISSEAFFHILLEDYIEFIDKKHQPVIS